MKLDNYTYFRNNLNSKKNSKKNMQISELFKDYYLEIKYGINWIISVIFGAGVSYVFKNRDKPFDWYKAITTVLGACLLGYIADITCTNLHYDNWRGVIVSLSALISSSVIEWFFNNEKNVISDLWNVFKDFLRMLLKVDKNNNINNNNNI